jgi:hypothetical protein
METITRNRKKFLKGAAGQMMIEFTFSMIMALIMIYSAVMVLRWSGLDLAERRLAHDKKLRVNIDENASSIADGPLKQLDSYFYQPMRINATFK